MPLLPGQLDQQRAQALKDLTERCTIEQYTRSRDNTGEWSKGWAPKLTNVPCRVVAVANLSSRERARLDAIGQVSEWQVVVPVAQSPVSKDRITITSGPSTGRVFDVSLVIGRHTDAIRCQCMVDETEGGS